MLWRGNAFCIQRPLLFVRRVPSFGRRLALLAGCEKIWIPFGSAGPVFPLFYRRAGDFLLEAVEAADGLEPKNMALLFLRRGSFPAGLRAGAFVLSVPGIVKKGEKEMGLR